MGGGKVENAEMSLNYSAGRSHVRWMVGGGRPSRSPRGSLQNINFDAVFGQAPLCRDFGRVLIVPHQLPPPRTPLFPLIPATPPRHSFPNSSGHETNDLPFR